MLQSELQEKIKPLITKYIKQAHLTRTIKDISVYDKCSIYTDFNTVIIWNKNMIEDDMIQIYRNYLILLFTYAISVRKGIIDTYYHLEQLLYEPFSDEIPKKLKQTHKKWLNTIID